jgi:hypothetical protein
MRYLYDQAPLYFNRERLSGPALLAIRASLDRLRRWDVENHPDRYVAISAFVAGRIRRAYGLESEVLYPPVDVERFRPGPPPEDYYLIVSSLSLHHWERPADAELNEAYRILSDPKLRLQHLLRLEDADLGAGRDLPPGLAELFWNAGALFREIDRWAHQNEAASNSLSRALLSGERTKLEARLTTLDEQLRARYESELEQLQSIDPGALPNEINNLI